MLIVRRGSIVTMSTIIALKYLKWHFNPVQALLIRENSLNVMGTILIIVEILAQLHLN
jgi:hypothetical protein